MLNFLNDSNQKSELCYMPEPHTEDDLFKSFKFYKSKKIKSQKRLDRKFT